MENITFKLEYEKTEIHKMFIENGYELNEEVGIKYDFDCDENIFFLNVDYINSHEWHCIGVGVTITIVLECFVNFDVTIENIDLQKLCFRKYTIFFEDDWDTSFTFEAPSELTEKKLKYYNILARNLFKKHYVWG